MEESLPPGQRIALNWKNVSSSIRDVVTNRVFLRYTAITTLLFSALSSYVASSEHIIGEIYGRPELFAWIFAGMGMLMSLCTLTNSRLSAKFGAQKTAKGLLTVYVIAGGLLLLATMLFGDPPSMPLFFGAVVVMLAINLAVEPNSSALALEPMGNMAGVAASVYGTIFFSVGASLGSIVSNLMVDGVYPLVLSFFSIGVIAIVLVFGDKR
jgi:DHA1 family bicyclomycin/chloramphenicol resistance-like MFS transporter